MQVKGTYSDRVVEFSGFIARAVSRQQLTVLASYATQLILILLAPILFAAAIYMFLGRVIQASTYQKYSTIPTRWLTKVFVTGDILCFIVQASGASKLIKPKSQAELDAAQRIILTGLGLQVLIFTLFLMVSITFHRRLVYSKAWRHVPAALRIRLMLWTIYLASALVLVRNIFRFVEYALPHDGYLIRTEWPMFAMDVALMVVLMTVTMLWYKVDIAGLVEKASETIGEELSGARMSSS
ncbi:RTA1-like protein 3 [Elsinoe fawcettii]|nr:RTA1-like protein 3 [Elsinoe fawcettii]